MNTDQPTSRQVIADLTNTFIADTGDLDRLHSNLIERADAAGILDVAYRTMDSPLGTLLIAATPSGVVRIAFEREDHDQVLNTLATTVSERMLRSGRRTDDVARQLDEYFAGQRRSFDLPVDLQLVTGFRHTVISQLGDIGYGATASYRVVAELVGNPAAVRAVGSACSHNPVPLVMPCHRVVRSDGTIGQYVGGSDAKATLLDMEATQ
ncbi:MAG: methylated-DNA--[protein]-cysteine S-methyltransferase [Ilumatobacter sp.]